ncbi:MAG: zinc-ribbon domain-containing protein [bacterium]|nr:zinc-ribbon domain-containing protein [bacterium]
MKCQQCNTKNDPYAMYCIRCGAALAWHSDNELTPVNSQETIFGQNAENLHIEEDEDSA